MHLLHKIIQINFNQELNVASLLGTLLVKKPTTYMTLIIINFWLVEMSSFMKQYFHSKMVRLCMIHTWIEPLFLFTFVIKNQSIHYPQHFLDTLLHSLLLHNPCLMIMNPQMLIPLQCRTLNHNAPNVSQSLQPTLLITHVIWPLLNLLPRLQVCNIPSQTIFVQILTHITISISLILLLITLNRPHILLPTKIQVGNRLWKTK